jgi:regulatory protein
VIARRTARPPKSCIATAIRMLARREYGRAELRGRLIERGADAQEAERALDELERRGYLSDARFAQAVVAQKAGRYGRRAIAHELKERGVAADAAQAALAVLAGTDELAEAMALWRKRFDRPPADEREKARQVRFLVSRGYGVSVALKVLRAVAHEATD